MVVDRQLRSDTTVLTVGRTPWTRGSCMRICCGGAQVIVEDVETGVGGGGGGEGGPV